MRIGVWKHPDGVQYAEYLKSLGVEDELVVYDPLIPTKELHTDTEVAGLFGFKVPPGAFRCWPKLRWFQSTGAGVDYLDWQQLPRDLLVTRVVGAFGSDIAEYVVGTLAGILKRLYEIRDNQYVHRWERLPVGTLEGKSVGIAGAGEIGSKVAQTLVHFNCSVRVLGRHRPDVPQTQGYQAAQREEFLDGLDVLVLALPVTPETSGFLDRGAIRKLNPGAIVINVGRGALIKTDSLKEALSDGSIGFAVLDVFDQEPLPSEDSLWTYHNVFITPHMAGPPRMEKICRFIADNTARFHHGLPLLGTVDSTRHY